MPKLNPLRLHGPETDLGMIWAAGVMEAALRVRLHITSEGVLHSTRLQARLDPEVGERIQKLLGGVYNGKYWQADGDHQLAIAHNLQKYTVNKLLNAKLSAVLAFRRTIQPHGVALTPAILMYRRKLLERFRECAKGRLPKDLEPLEEPDE